MRPPGSVRALDEVCDEFPDVHGKWSFRMPKCNKPCGPDPGGDADNNGCTLYSACGG